MDVVINAPGSGGYVAGGSQLSAADIGLMTGSPVPALGVDLSNDHPISIQYGGGGCTAADPACTTLGDLDFVTPANDLINSVRVWWVDTGTQGNGKQKTDMQLYTRSDVAGGVGQEPTVECGSCHDPHEATARPVSFMRISNDNSDVCTACHNK
jgi:predicted CXXCH cytochrome family protein